MDYKEIGEKWLIWVRIKEWICEFWSEIRHDQEHLHNRTVEIILSWPEVGPFEFSAAPIPTDSRST